MLSIDEKLAIQEVFERARHLAGLWEQDGNNFDETKKGVQKVE